MEPVRYQQGIVRSENARFGFKIIKFCQGKIDGRAFHAFIAIEPQNLAYFENHYRPGVMSDFSAYGQELLRGWDETPREMVVDYLKYKHDIEFGVDPAYILHLAQLTLQKGRDQTLPPPFPDRSVTKYPEKPAEAHGT